MCLSLTFLPCVFLRCETKVRMRYYRVIAHSFPGHSRAGPKVFNVSIPSNYTALSSRSYIRLFTVYLRDDAIIALVKDHFLDGKNPKAT